MIGYGIEVYEMSELTEVLHDGYFTSVRISDDGG